jgi:hypothetical protein
MPSRGQSITVTYQAWNVTSNLPATGDSANHTLRWVKDGIEAAPTNAPVQVDSTNLPGIYKVTLTATECTCDCGTIGGISSTAGVYLFGVVVTFEQLPAAAPNAAGGLITSGTAAGQLNVNGGIADANVKQALGTAVTTATAGLLDVNVKNYNNTAVTSVPPGAAAIATAVWSDTTGSDFAAVSSPGKILVGQLGGAFTSTSSSVYNAPALVNAPVGTLTAAAIATAVWTDVNSTDLNVIGSPGKIIATQLGSAFTSTSSSVYTVAALANAPGGSGGGGSDPWLTYLPGAYAAGSAGYIVGHNLDVPVSTRSTYAGGAVASVTAPVSVGTITDKSGYILAPTGLDQISVADPGAAATMNTLPKMIVGLWRWFYRLTTMTKTQMNTYADNNVTINSSGSLNDDGTTQTKGSMS